MTDPVSDALPVSVPAPESLPAPADAVAAVPDTAVPDAAPEAAAPADAQPRANRPATPAGAGQRGAAAARKPRSERPARPVLPLLQRLFELHPKLFGARFLPLKLGAFEDLMARHPGAFERDALKEALGTHARSTRYLESVANGDKRHDLDGNPVDDLAPEHVHHAIVEVYKRRRGRTAAADLQPWLQERLLRAVRRAGLSREDYLARMRVPDGEVAAALDEAFAQMGAQAARQEALRRAFATSGKGIEEFAGMYGMAVGEVQRALDAASPPAQP